MKDDDGCIAGARPGIDLPLTCERVIQAAVAVFGVTEQDLRGRSLIRRHIAARQAAMYVCRVVADESLPSIGESFGGRDHMTVLHSIRSVDQLMAGRNAIAARVVELTTSLGARNRPGRPGLAKVGGRRAG